jgi:hypothetical protein
MSKALKLSSEDLKRELMAVTAKVAERVELLLVWLVESTVKRTPGPTEGLDYTTNTEAKVEMSRKPDRLFLLEKFILKALPRKKKEATVSIEATFLLTYQVEGSDPLDPAHAEAFARVNGIYNAWPYWREYVQSVTSRMGFPGLTLPVFRLSDLNFSVGPGGLLVAEFNQTVPDDPGGKADASKKGAQS